MICPECVKLGFRVPMAIDGHLLRCRLCGYKIERKDDDDKERERNLNTD